VLCEKTASKQSHLNPEMLGFLQGLTVSLVLWHLQDEQSTHALALPTEQERCKQEAAEARQTGGGGETL
jgi:hypothetical protein